MTDEITAPFASEKRKLLLNSDKIHTTKMGAVRRRGKNYYCTVGGITITVNARNFTIITAHRKKS